MPRNDHVAQDGKFAKFHTQINESILNIAEEYGLDVELSSATCFCLKENPNDRFMGGSYSNHSRCIECGVWTSAQNKDNPIVQLMVGAEYNGDMYCEDHLPVASPMYKEIHFL
jgi:hypothetical protein